MAQKLSDSMFFMKRVFPAIWFGFLVIMVTITPVSAIRRSAAATELVLVVIPIFMAMFGYAVMAPDLGSRGRGLRPRRLPGRQESWRRDQG